jgi:hypothetical protein
MSITNKLRQVLGYPASLMHFVFGAGQQNRTAFFKALTTPRFDWRLSPRQQGYAGLNS